MAKEQSGGTVVTEILLGLLAIAFVVLKLTDVIDWSWWWVLCPLWGVSSIAVVALVIWLHSDNES